jgi:hypothetical protein
MHRTVIVALVAVVTLAFDASAAMAQTSATTDSVAHSPVDAGPVVDTASQKWTYTRRDRVLASCESRSQSPVSNVLPLFCAQQLNRLNSMLDRIEFDSVTIVRNGREYRLAARNVGGIPFLNRQRKSHAIAGALIGGGLGFATAAFASVQSGVGFGSSALILGGTGAVIGAFSGSKYVTGWPRVLQEEQR